MGKSLKKSIYHSMKKTLIVLLFLPLISTAKEPVVSHPDSLKVSSTEKSDLQVEVLVGKEKTSTVKDQITRKALLLGLTIEVSEKFQGWQDLIKIELKPSVDQQQEVKEFKLFLKDL